MNTQTLHSVWTPRHGLEPCDRDDGLLVCAPKRLSSVGLVSTKLGADLRWGTTRPPHGNETVARHTKEVESCSGRSHSVGNSPREN